MRFGIAKDLITPDRQTYMSGYGSFFNNPFAGIHDDLFVRAFLVDDGKDRLLFVSLDLLFHDYALTQDVQAYAEEHHGISRDHLFLTFSHTHGGPAVSGYDDTSQHSAEYEAFLLARIKSCINRAMCNRFEGTLAYGSATGDWNINRRSSIEGIVHNLPNPEGAKDDLLQVLRVVDTSQRTKVILFNYACHPVTVRDTPYLSADYPGRICQLLEAEFFGVTGIFFQGAGGNSRPKATARNGVFVTCTYDEVDEMAAAMTLAIKRLCSTSGAWKQVDLKLAACQFMIPLELEPFPKSRIASAADDVDGFPGIKRIASRVLQDYDQLPDEVLLPAGLIRLNDDLYIAYMGGEPCYEVKRKLAALFTGVTLLFFGYADSTAYIPDDTIIAEGGYEAADSAIEYGLKGSFKQGIDKSMAEAFRGAYRELK